MTDQSARDPTTQRERTTLDELFDVLSKPPRRRILSALAETNSRAVTEFVPGEVTGDERREDVLVRLHHTHLPKLDEPGFIEWNPDSQTVERGPRFDEVVPVVELLLDHRDELPSGWP